MNKQELDMLYHNLRRLSVTDDIPQKEAVSGIVSHLMSAGGDYPGLLRFSAYYGALYICPEVIKFLGERKSVKFSRVVELGAGLGWLGRGIANAFGQLPALFIDKRQYTLIDVVADIETKNGVKRVLDELRDEDLIVVVDVLHCLEDPRKVMRSFAKWPILVVEYYPDYSPFGVSWTEQLAKFGAKPIASIFDVFPKSLITSSISSTHGIWLVKPIQNKY